MLGWERAHLWSETNHYPAIDGIITRTPASGMNVTAFQTACPNLGFRDGIHDDDEIDGCETKQSRNGQRRPLEKESTAGRDATVQDFVTSDVVMR